MGGEIVEFDLEKNEVKNAVDACPNSICGFNASYDRRFLLSYTLNENETKIWDLSENFMEKKTLPSIINAEFGHLSNSIICGNGTRGEIKIYDTETGNILVELQENENENDDERCLSSTFSYDDQLVLCDGILWDYRNTRQIHKFDKFTAYGSEKFNKNGFEVIINAEIWDLRTYKLIRTVPALDQQEITMNNLGDVIFAIQHKHKKNTIIYGKNFTTIDACDYDLITNVQLDHNRLCFGLALANDDMSLAVLERGENIMDPVVRLWEIGAIRSSGDEGQDESDEDDIEEEENEYPLNSSEEDDLFTLSDHEDMDDDFIDEEDDFIDEEFE